MCSCIDSNTIVLQVDSYGNPTEVEYGGCGHHVSAPTLDSVQDILPAVDQAENCEPFGESNETDADPGHGSGTEQENLANMPSMLVILYSYFLTWIMVQKPFLSLCLEFIYDSKIEPKERAIEPLMLAASMWLDGDWS